MVGNRVDVGHKLNTLNNVRMAMSSLWRGPDNINGFIMDGKYYRYGWVTAQTPIEPAVSGVRITTSTSRYCVG